MCSLSFLKWGSIVYSLGIVQWDFTRRDHPGNPGRVSGSGPVNDAPWEADGEGETSQVKEHNPYKPPGEDCNEGIPGRNNIGNGPILY